MKNIKHCLLTFSAVCLLSACDSNDNRNNGQYQNIDLDNRKVISDELSGVWLSLAETKASVKMDNTTLKGKQLIKEYLIIDKADNTLTMKGCDTDIQYTISGNKLLHEQHGDDGLDLDFSIIDQSEIRGVVSNQDDSGSVETNLRMVKVAIETSDQFATASISGTLDGNTISDTLPLRCFSEKWSTQTTTSEGKTIDETAHEIEFETTDENINFNASIEAGEDYYRFSRMIEGSLYTTSGSAEKNETRILSIDTSATSATARIFDGANTANINVDLDL
ncbi:Uncharacterised protein [BD1-7 clade bacterium]|uniref:Uncharacterized protein n=1 Tax=BD1-7 clade bacterium TaxID=2029982 RepID=A0A5S9QIQ5_9GAMM|nr:Uncharacterised protein [BD1-7 clade bacterium]CAA0117639.1 Uncharacterised protein [BD1-7 clade bacterium]